MNLLNATSWGKQMCYACRFAGENIVLWPQELVVAPVDWNSVGSWKVHRADHATPSHLPGRNGKKVYNFCYQHWTQLYETWVQLALDEVWLEHLWHQHIERMEG